MTKAFETARTTSLTGDLYAHAKSRVPGGAHLFGKRPECYAPERWPAYYREARGCEVWDLDGRHYYDISTNGIGSCLLGFQDPDVTDAVVEAIRKGSMCTLNPPEEVELADMLCDIHPWADQVRFSRAGGETCAIAVRIARATTDRSLVAVCGYHGWQDWYLAANLGENDATRGHLLPGLSPLGVPRELRGTAPTFRFNSREEFQRILDNHGDRLAAVVMEPCRICDPEPGFLEFVRNGAHRHGALVIFDEITIGWRLTYGGSHLKFGTDPDMAIFAKSLANGHPMGAVIGTKEAMSGAHDSFISSTYWTERTGPVAALATLRKMRRLNVPGVIAHAGLLATEAWRQNAAKYGLPVITGEAYPCLTRFRFEHEQETELMTLFTQIMLDKGFLSGALFYPTIAHTDEIMSMYSAAVDEAFAEIARAVDSGDVTGCLNGPVAEKSFKRLI